MGYMCEIMDDEDSVPPAVVNKILGTIVDGMQASRSDPVRLAATQALNNSLYFTEANFASETERNVLVTAMCEATQCRDVNVRKAAYECLGRVAELYYDHLGPYVATIFNLTTTAIRTDSEDVAIPAISFWTSVCESEIDRKERIEEREVPTPLMLNLIETAAQPLTACLLEAMTKQPEEVDEDEWNLNEAASECLEEVAANIKKNVIPHVLPFIQQHITSPEWNNRDAAVSAFGHILGGPDASSTKAIVEMGIATILQLTQDQHERVRWSAVWTLGKICETHKECTDPVIQSIISAFMASLQDKNIFIVAKACYGISNLALACQQDEDDSNGNILSPFYYNLVEKLLAVAARPSTDDGNFRSIAYETINGLVENSSKMEIQVNKAILSESVNRLESTWHAAATMDAKDRHDMQSSICTLISQVLKKLNRIDLPVAPDGDRIMNLLLGILSEKGIAGNDDAAFAVGAMADLMEDDFVRYINHLRPMLLRGLSVTDDYQTCIISVGLLGDICRAVKGKVCAAETGFCDDYVHCLINLCQSNTIDRSVKPEVISFFADLAMAIEGDFERYIPPVLPILVSAGMIVVEDSMDEDTIDYINQLRAGILEAYTGILQVSFSTIFPVLLHLCSDRGFLPLSPPPPPAILRDCILPANKTTSGLILDLWPNFCIVSLLTIRSLTTCLRTSSGLWETLPRYTAPKWASL